MKAEMDLMPVFFRVCDSLFYSVKSLVIIFEELEIGVVKESTLAELVTIINRMKESDGIEGIILGCTELPLILNSGNCPVKCFDSVDIHLKKLVSLSMK